MKIQILCLSASLAAIPLPAEAKPQVAQAVDAATREALREPSAQGFVGAAQIYAFSEGALYRLIAAPERVTDIALEPGEALISVAAGDTLRWTVGDTVSGAGPAQRVHIMIKPVASGLKTNLVITTDRRVYHLALESTARAAMASIGWSYPAGALLAIRREAGREAAAVPAASGIDPARLDFGYRIRGDAPPWRPLRAFDDGRQTFIEFPASLGQGEAPPLFVTGADGKAELVNYRLSGRYYIVDRLFAAAELRHGARKQDVVRICSDRAAKPACKGKGK
jgi:P-type conjugative transfer protein TrbG